MTIIEIEKGHTFRIIVEFKDFDGNLVTPDYIKFKVYDRRFVEIATNDITVDNQLRDIKGNPIEGSFCYDYTTNDIGEFYIEFVGIVNGRQSLKRDKVKVVFNN